MRVMIVEDQVMIRGLLETYFTKENGDQIVASIPGAGQAWSFAEPDRWI